MNPIVTVSGGGNDLRFWAVGRVAYNRGMSLLSKEPDTIAWIDTLAENDVLNDIGVYTMYAALRRRCRVITSGPSAVNYAELVRNIALDNIEQRVTSLCAASYRSERGPAAYVVNNYFSRPYKDRL